MTRLTPIPAPTDAGAPSPEAEPCVKERVVASAIRLFCEKGYEATSVREIVDAAGVTKPVLYYYFKNKEGLFAHILQTVTERFRKALDTAMEESEGDFEDSLRRFAGVFITYSRASPDLVRFFHAIAFSGLYDQIFDFEAYWRGIFALLAQRFDDAQSRGLARQDISAKALARYYMGMSEAVMRSIVFNPEETDIPDHEDPILEVARWGMFAPGI